MASSEDNRSIQELICQPCKREDTYVTAVKWCTKCEESLCSECYQFHSKDKSSKNHHVVAISCVDMSPQSNQCNKSKTDRNVQAAETCNDIDHNKTLHCNFKFDFGHEFNLYIQGIAVTDDDNVLICDKNSHRVIFYSSSGQYLATCNTKQKPFNICALDGLDEAVVTLPSESKLEFICTTTMKSLRIVDCLPHPWGITDTGDEIIVGFNCKLQFFTRGGQVLCIVDIPHLGFMAPCYLFPVDTNHILVSCEHVYNITRDGNVTFQHKFPTCRPNGICVDRSKCSYIATRNIILRLSEDGTVLDNNVLDNKYDYGDLWAISFNSNFTKLYASTDNGKSVTVFDFK